MILRQKIIFDNVFDLMVDIEELEQYGRRNSLGFHNVPFTKDRGGSRGGRTRRAVKNHDFTTKNHIFSNCGGRRENIWSISCEKSRFYAKKNHIFSNFLGARAGCAPSLNHPLNQLAGYI
jgi:hypothetical protein